MNIIFQTLAGQLMVVVTLAFGALLIALYPLLQKRRIVPLRGSVL